MEIMSIYRTTPMKPEKTLKEYSAPSSEFLKQPIEFPNPGVREYRFDGGIIKILQEKAFSGREDTGRHLREFDDVITSLGPKGLPRDFSRLKLFRWSLKGKALDWLYSLPRHYIKCWENCIVKFINRFNPFKKVTELRKNIGNFSQNMGENYPQAWERFFGMINSIPNHGYSELTICHLFYHGLNTQCRELLDFS